MKGRGAQTIVLPKNLLESNGAKNTPSEHGTLWLLLQGHRVVGSQLRPWLHSILFQSGCDQARTVKSTLEQMWANSLPGQAVHVCSHGLKVFFC